MISYVCDSCGCEITPDSKRVNVTHYSPSFKDIHFCPKCWYEEAPASRVKELEQQHADDAALVTELTASVARAEKRADDLNKLLAEKKADVETFDRAAGKLAEEVTRLKVELSDARDEAEFGSKAVVELLGMLGKKARRRNSERVAELEREYLPELQDGAP